MDRKSMKLIDTATAPTGAPLLPLSPCSPSMLRAPVRTCESPLYTEINIPLPPLPESPVATTPASPTSPETKRRHRNSLSALRSFHRRRSSQPAAGMPTPEQAAKPEHRIELSMSAASRGGRKRSGTVGAAIVPAVMVLRAELFTPGQGEREKNIDMKDRLEVVPSKPKMQSKKYPKTSPCEVVDVVDSVSASEQASTVRMATAD